MADSDNGVVHATAARLIPQPHGGALRSGGTKGQKGGTGRPASAIRRAMRHAMADRIGILEEIADNPQCSPSDRMKAIDLLGKYGLGARFALEVAAKMGKRKDELPTEEDETDGEAGA